MANGRNHAETPKVREVKVKFEVKSLKIQTASL